MSQSLCSHLFSVPCVSLTIEQTISLQHPQHVVAPVLFAMQLTVLPSEANCLIILSFILLQIHITISYTFLYSFKT